MTQVTQGDGKLGNYSYTAASCTAPITETVVTDPRGYVTDLYFDSNSYLTESVEAVGEPEQQTTTINRAPTTELISSTVDQLNRETSYTYDPLGLGNVTSVTRTANTSPVNNLLHLRADL